MVENRDWIAAVITISLAAVFYMLYTLTGWLKNQQKTKQEP